MTSMRNGLRVRESVSCLILMGFFVKGNLTREEAYRSSSGSEDKLHKWR